MPTIMSNEEAEVREALDELFEHLDPLALMYILVKCNNNYLRQRALIRLESHDELRSLILDYSHAAFVAPGLTTSAPLI